MRFHVFSSPKDLYEVMLKDIESAKKSIYLETYIYGRDEIGRKFRRALEKKAAQGVKVQVLIDAFGSGSFKNGFLKNLIKNATGTEKGLDKRYFYNLIKLGGEVRFFKEFRYVFRIFGQNHERNHRKLLIIDDNISYIGSANITSACLNWRELVLRLHGKISEHLSKSFINHWLIADNISVKKLKFIFHKSFEIIHDLPADARMLTASRYVKLINSAENEILIETPYFVPPIRIRNALARAVKRGVKIILLLPFKSDVTFLDILKNRYLGSLYRKGVNIYYFNKGILHSKLLLVDNKFFLLGSSNLDYRSFVHQHEINLFGTNKEIISCLRSFYKEGISKSKPFNYQEWKSRSSFIKVLEILSSLIDDYF